MQISAKRSEGKDGSRREAILKAGVVGLYFIVWWLIYDHVNRYASDPSRTFQLRSPAQVLPALIQPWTALIYGPGGLLLAWLPFFHHRTWRGIGVVLAAYTLAAIVAFSCYALWPLSMARGANMGRDHESTLLRWIYTVDLPANCFPSFHAIFATFGFLFVAHSRAPRRRVVGVFIVAMLVMATTITTGQHYFADAPAGAVLASLVFLGLRRFLIVEPTSAPTQD